MIGEKAEAPPPPGAGWPGGPAGPRATLPGLLPAPRPRALE